jgi:pimeloyl-ACP methyl ester carboxylesterase
MIGMTSWQTVLGEARAFLATTLAMPFGATVPDTVEPSAGPATPIVLVHGIFGHPTGFWRLRQHLEGQGLTRFASFAYGPRLDYQRLSADLGALIETVRARSGAPQVDVVGHSLGGLVGRYLVEHGDARHVRRLVSLGSPWYGDRFPHRELALFAEGDVLVPVPGSHAHGGRVEVVRGCGHLGLLHHPEVLARVSAFLAAPLPATARVVPLRRAA